MPTHLLQRLLPKVHRRYFALQAFAGPCVLEHLCFFRADLLLIFPCCWGWSKLGCPGCLHFCCPCVSWQSRGIMLFCWIFDDTLYVCWALPSAVVNTVFKRNLRLICVLSAMQSFHVSQNASESPFCSSLGASVQQPPMVVLVICILFSLNQMTSPFLDRLHKVFLTQTLWVFPPPAIAEQLLAEPLFP